MTVSLRETERASQPLIHEPAASRPAEGGPGPGRWITEGRVDVLAGLAFGLMAVLCTMENHSRVGRVIASGVLLAMIPLAWKKGWLDPRPVLRFVWPVAAVYTAILVSCAFSIAPGESWSMFLRQHLWFGLIFLGVGAWSTKPVPQRYFLWGLLGAGLYSAAAGIVLYYFAFRFEAMGIVDQSKDFIYSAHDAGGAPYYRAMGLLESYTRSAMVFILTMPACIALAVSMSRQRRRGLLAVCVVAILCSVWYLLLTKSRGAWGAVLLGGFLVCLVARLRWWVMAGIVGVVAVFLAILPASRERALTLVQHINNPDLFFSGRIELWRQGIRPIRENLVTGVGYGGDIFESEEARAVYPLVTDRVQPDLHQLYLQTLAEVGLLGIVAYGWLIGMIVYTSVRVLWRCRGGDDWIGVGAPFAGLMAMLAIGVVYYMNEQLVAHLLWAVAGIVGGGAAVIDGRKKDSGPGLAG